jgi:hypothetical protein
MTSTTKEILARIGEDPARLCTLDEVIETLRKVGFPLAKGTLYKMQCAGDGPPRFIWTNRSVYKIGDVLGWALARVKKPEDGPAVRSAQTRSRAKRENIGAEAEAIAA